MATEAVELTGTEVGTRGDVADVSQVSRTEPVEVGGTVALPTTVTEPEVLAHVCDAPAVSRFDAGAQAVAGTSQFEQFLRWRYAQLDLLERFPNGF